MFLGHAPFPSPLGSCPDPFGRVRSRALPRWLACSIGLLVAVATAPAFAQEAGGAPAEAPSDRGGDLVERGRSLYDELRYEEALQTLSAALLHPENRDARAAIYRLLALTYLSLGLDAEAEGAFRGLLAIEPEFQLDAGESPRFREFFVEVRGRWEADGRPGLPPPAPVAIAHRSPAQAERTRAIDLTARVDDPQSRVASLVLAYRQGTASVFRRIDALRRGADYVATIPGNAVLPPLVEYYFEALDATGLPVAQRGDVAAPLRITVEAESESLLSQWWFWAGAAVVVAGAVTVGVLLATDDDPQGTLVVSVF